MSSFIFCRRGALGCSRAHFNPRTPCRVRLASLENCSFLAFYISIHAPLAGCDLLYTSVFGKHVISIHAPLTGCDTPCRCRPQIAAAFQSTHPSRGATLLHQIVDTPHAISIHAPLTGCDPESGLGSKSLSISIHAPLAGCDAHQCGGPAGGVHFNPRTPYGVRQQKYTNSSEYFCDKRLFLDSFTQNAAF